MESEKERWINKIIESGDELHTLKAPHSLLDAINHSLQDTQVQDERISFGQLRIAMIAAAMLIVVNGAILFSAGTKISQKKPGADKIESYNLNIY